MDRIIDCFYARLQISGSTWRPLLSRRQAGISGTGTTLRAARRLPIDRRRESVDSALVATPAPERLHKMCQLEPDPERGGRAFP